MMRNDCAKPAIAHKDSTAQTISYFHIQQVSINKYGGVKKK
jgi:hypothetical protein